MTIQRRIIAELQTAPATTGEIAVALKLRSKLACAHLRNLMSRGHVQRIPFMGRAENQGPRQLFLWSIDGERVPRGRDEIERQADLDHQLPFVPDPLNAEFRRWTDGAGKGRALQALDVHTDPLRWAL